jgi:hypothetical protein
MLCFLVAVCLVMIANMRVFSIYEQVNERLPKDARFDAVGFGAREKFFEVLRLHAEMFPDSPKRWQMWTLMLSGFAFGFGGFYASWILPR